MSLGVKILSRVKIDGGAAGRRVLVTAQFTGDTDIPAAGTGYTVNAASLGVGSIISGATTPDTTGVYFTTYATDGKFRWFNADDAVEAAAGENAVDTLVAFGTFVCSPIN